MSVTHSTQRSKGLEASLILALMRRPLLRDRVALVRAKGPVGALRRLGGASRQLEARARAWLLGAQKRGLTLLSLEDEGYPRLLRLIEDPPLVLTVWGALSPEDALAIAVVGSRRATAYGLQMAEHLAEGLSGRGLSIVSGLARGIDAAAHRGALSAGGRTVAVLGSGHDRLYPSEHRKLAERVARNGAVLSEFAFDEPPHARNFPRRNRIITGLALGTLVVEAAAKSGSLVSARLALEQNRDVYAVPGPARSGTSEGTHALIRDGAPLVTCAEHVIEELRAEVQDALTSTKAQKPPAAPGSADERRVYDALEDARPVDFDTLIEAVRLPIDRAVAAVSALELKGAVLALPGGLYQRSPKVDF